MGTSYYLHEKTRIDAVTEDNADSGLHIGKSSAGWKFHFESHPFFRNLEEVLKFLELGDIYSEYGEYYTTERFLKEVVYYKERGDRTPPADYWNYHADGFAFSRHEFS